MKKSKTIAIILLLIIIGLLGCEQVSTNTSTITSTSQSSPSTEPPTTSQTSSPTDTILTTTFTTTLSTTTTTIPNTTTSTATHQTYQTLDLTPLSWVDENEASTDLINPYRGMKAYTLSDAYNRLSVITPHKFDKNNGLTIDLREFDLSGYRSLVVTAKGDGVMKLTINSKVTILNGKNIILYPLTTINDTFEFSFDFEGYERVLGSIESITIVFGADVNETNLPTHRFVSEIRVETLMFTERSANPRLTFNTQGSLYDPDEGHSTDPMTLTQNWNIRDAGSYVITQQENGVRIVSTLQKQPWSYINLILEGHYQQYTQLVIQVQGDPGSRFKMKLEGPGITTYETGSTANGNISDPELNGTVQTFTWSLSSSHLPSGQAVSFLIFFEPGQIGSGKQMVIFFIRLQ